MRFGLTEKLSLNIDFDFLFALCIEMCVCSDTGTASFTPHMYTLLFTLFSCFHAAFMAHLYLFALLFAAVALVATPTALANTAHTIVLSM